MDSTEVSVVLKDSQVIDQCTVMLVKLQMNYDTVIFDGILLEFYAHTHAGMFRDGVKERERVI